MPSATQASGNETNMQPFLAIGFYINTSGDFPTIGCQNSCLGEIRMFAFNFAPPGWEQCNGQLLPINQNAALFSLLGTTYGGDGQTTFGLPDLRGRVPVGTGSGPGLTPRSLGSGGGGEGDSHTHPIGPPPP